MSDVTIRNVSDHYSRTWNESATERQILGESDTNGFAMVGEALLTDFVLTQSEGYASQIVEIIPSGASAQREVLVPLDRAGEITLTCLDLSGDPVEGALVALSSLPISESTLRNINPEGTQAFDPDGIEARYTDSLGIASLGDIHEGQYLVYIRAPNHVDIRPLSEAFLTVDPGSHVRRTYQLAEIYAAAVQIEGEFRSISMEADHSKWIEVKAGILKPFTDRLASEYPDCFLIARVPASLPTGDPLAITCSIIQQTGAQHQVTITMASPASIEKQSIAVPIGPSYQLGEIQIHVTGKGWQEGGLPNGLVLRGQGELLGHSYAVPTDTGTLVAPIGQYLLELTGRNSWAFSGFDGLVCDCPGQATVLAAEKPQLCELLVENEKGMRPSSIRLSIRTERASKTIQFGGTDTSKVQFYMPTGTTRIAISSQGHFPISTDVLIATPTTLEPYPLYFILERKR